MGISRDRDRQIDGAGWWGGVTHRESRTILCALKDNLHFTFQFLVAFLCTCVCVCWPDYRAICLCLRRAMCMCVCVWNDKAKLSN